MEAKVPCAVTEEDVWWLSKKKVIGDRTTFNAVDGLHHASVNKDGMSTK
jgi:hypothetical protein